MRPGRNYFKRGISYLKRNGLKKTLWKSAERIQMDTAEKDYVPYHADERTLHAQRNREFRHPYKISILVPVYETDPHLFKKMLDSVGDQTYGNWELILADASADSSRRDIVRSFLEQYNLRCKDRYGSPFDKVTYVKLGENKGISGNTNEALKRAHGDYVALLDHDDILENTALFDIMSAIEEEENAGRDEDSIKKVMAVYTDEDKITSDGSTYFSPHYKPDFDPVALCTNNYICHFFAVDADLAKGTGGFRPEYDGAQDHDFILRCVEGIRRDQIIHIPKVLYHWRSTQGSTAENPDSKLYAYEAGKKAVADHFKRMGLDVKVTDTSHLGFFELDYALPHDPVMCITTESYRRLSESSSELPGDGYIMILSGDLAPEDRDYARIMASCMCLPFVGCVTGKIIGRNKKIESAGFDTDESGQIVPCFNGLDRRFSGYMHRTSTDRLVDAFSEDCVLVRLDAVKEIYPHIVLKDGFDVYYMARAEFVRKSV